MELVRQPNSTNLCGQACVAMVAGISLDDAIKCLNTKGRTTAKQLIGALDHYFVKHGRIRRGAPDSGLSAICSFGGQDWRRHWVVWHDYRYYDPMAGVFRKVPDYLQEARIVSHFNVEPV